MGAHSRARKPRLESPFSADVAQLVERELPKLEVAGSKPVVRFAGRRGHEAFAAVAAAPRARYSRAADGGLQLPDDVVRRRADPGRLGRHLGQRPLPGVVEGRAQGRRARARRRARHRRAEPVRVARQAALLAGVRHARDALRAAVTCSRATPAESSSASASGGCTRGPPGQRSSTAGTCRRHAPG